MASIRAFLFVALCTFITDSSVFAQPVQPETREEDFRTRRIDPEIRERQARQLGYYQVPEKLYLGLCIPRPISEAELNTIAEILLLSDAQRLKYRQLYDIYLDEDWEYRKKSIQPLWDRSAEIAPLSSDSSVEFGEAYAELFADRERALRPLFALEDKLLTDMVPYLTDAQLERLATARNYRSRQRCIVVPAMFPGCSIDLLERMRAVQLNDPDMVVSNPEEFTARAAEYDAAVTHLYETAAERRLHSMIENVRLRCQAKKIAETEADEELSKLRRKALGLERDSVNKKQLFANRAIHDLNKKYVDIFAALLPEDHGNELRIWFRESTYRSVYPDPNDLTDMFAELFESELFTPGQEPIVAAIQENFNRRQNELSERMVKEYLDWFAHLEIRHGYEIAVYEEYQETMTKLQNQRTENAFKAVESVMGVLEEDQLPAVESAAKEFRFRIQEFENYRAKLASQGREWPRHDE